MPESKTVLLTGATGFVGSHLPGELREQGWRVIGASRRPSRASARVPELEWRRLEVGQPTSIEQALEGCQAAIYLIHGMSAGAGYQDEEQRAALAFRQAAEQAGVQRIVYLGGIQPQGAPSRHLLSRLATGEILRGGRVSCIELQAAMVIGGGSQSWRIVRDLAARLPVMLLPSWLDSLSQPIAIQDVAFAISRAVSLDLDGSRAFPLPGPQTLSAREILERTARLLGSEPATFRVPVISPRLSSHWIRLVTRADRRIAGELVEGLRSDLVAADNSFWELFPEHERLGFDAAAKRALAEEEASLPLRSRAFERMLRSLSSKRNRAVGAPAKPGQGSL